MVAVNNRLFIFGGRDQFVDTAPITTYSIAEYNPQTLWTWRVSDAPLPPDLPLLGYSIQATPVYGGQKILLTQGRVHNDEVSPALQIKFRGCQERSYSPSTCLVNPRFSFTPKITLSLTPERRWETFRGAYLGTGSVQSSQDHGPRLYRPSVAVALRELFPPSHRHPLPPCRRITSQPR
jgi:hypothetical protein